MMNFLISLPDNTSLSDFKVVEVEHPKGKSVTFLTRENELFELHHFESKRGAYSCFVKEENETTVHSLAVLKAVKYDIIFLLIPILEKLETKGKVSIADLEMPENLRSVAMSKHNQEKMEKVFETKKLEDDLYIQLKRDKLMEYLKTKCDLLITQIESSKILDGSGPQRIKSYAAHLIKDCLSKDNAKFLDEALGIQKDELKENQPPAKKSKSAGGEPTEDYSKGEDASKPKAEIKLSKSQKDLAKAAKGTKSISSFFTPKKKSN